MKNQSRSANSTRRRFSLSWPLLPVLALAVTVPLRIAAQQTAQQIPQQTAPMDTDAAAASAEDGCRLPVGGSHGAGKTASHISPEQAQRLFAMVDTLLKFASNETGLPIESPVKRQLTTRDAVVKYLEEKLDEDQGAKRLERDEIVLRKFGLLDHDFQLKPFLLELLREQVEAYYDPKTKTVNLLDWVSPDEQQPVLAHELTHALQDQHVGLDTWDDQTPDTVSTDAAEDRDHLARDEMDTARNAVTEGQATAVMWNCVLKPMGKSLVTTPEVIDLLDAQMDSTKDSPVMARAPLLLSESLLFPYRDGLNFEQDVWMDEGRNAAFAGTLDQPPTSSWEILNPRTYEKKLVPPIPLLPNIHPLVDAAYQPYDIGQVGALDVRILTRLMGGVRAARDLTPAWNGGIYWAGQLRSAKTAAAQASTGSIALFYLSAWKNAGSADFFAKLYANNLGRKYASVREVTPEVPAGGDPAARVFLTNEGPVLITTRDKMVFVAEGFPQPLAQRLATLLFDAQGSGPVRVARSPHGSSALDPGAGDPGAGDPGATLTAGLVQFFAEAGVTKAAIDAERQALGTRAASMPKRAVAGSGRTAPGKLPSERTNGRLTLPSGKQ